MMKILSGYSETIFSFVISVVISGDGDVKNYWNVVKVEEIN